jgi:hypothetical protein
MVSEPFSMEREKIMIFRYFDVFIVKKNPVPLSSGGTGIAPDLPQSES